VGALSIAELLKDPAFVESFEGRMAAKAQALGLSDEATRRCLLARPPGADRAWSDLEFKSASESAFARAEEIVSVCRLVKQPGMANDFVIKGVTPKFVKDYFLNERAARDEATEIDTTRRLSDADQVSVWASRKS